MENNYAQICQVKSLAPIELINLDRSSLESYFRNTWEMYELLFGAINSQDSYYLSPDPLRNPLIFYWGHTAVFYINKMRKAGLLNNGINHRFEHIFAVGVDPEVAEHLKIDELWPSVEEVDAYREIVYDQILSVIANVEIPARIEKDSPLWSLYMSLEHDRIHFETSSVLIRQLPVELVDRPASWNYAPRNVRSVENKTIGVESGMVHLGKKSHSDIYGWDNEYGYKEVFVKSFEATQNLISNSEYLEFVQYGGYEDRRYWSTEGWAWKKRQDAHHPLFWVRKNESFLYRAMFDELEMPMDWPVEVNAHEAQAYCKWKGSEWRLMTEAEFRLIADRLVGVKEEPYNQSDFNLAMQFGSPSPVGYNSSSDVDFHDIYGNVWDWLSNDFYPLNGFEPHPLYMDFSEPYFDDSHGMMLGGSWASTGTGASKYYRLWFRRHFYQHAGFRIARDV